MKNIFAKKRPKLGLALGSGGAKGMAHLGALRAFWEAGLRFDVYSGTSAGSIVGALCARGYTPDDIGELLASADFKSVVLSVLASGSTLPVLRLLDGALGEYEFSELSKPFAAVATDASTGERVILREGNVAQAVLASSAVPPLFRGVSVGGRTLIDGAFSDAIPADVAKDLGADFVIAVALSPAQNYAETRFTTSAGEEMAVRQKGFLSADILLEPDLAEFSAADIAGGARMYDIGYECAAERLPSILQALRSRGYLVRG